jgi:hypothetical protein
MPNLHCLHSCRNSRFEDLFICHACPDRATAERTHQKRHRLPPDSTPLCFRLVLGLLPAFLDPFQNALAVLIQLELGDDDLARVDADGN